MRKFLMKRSTADHPELVPMACLLFGHARHNDLVARRGGGCYRGGNPCVRPGCPGDTHLWERRGRITGITETTRGLEATCIWHEVCRVPGCTVERSFRIPDMGLGGISVEGRDL